MLRICRWEGEGGRGGRGRTRAGIRGVMRGEEGSRGREARGGLVIYLIGTGISRRRRDAALDDVARALVEAEEREIVVVAVGELRL